MPNVLITGGGHVGAAAGRLFAEKNYKVIFYDVLKAPPAATADFILKLKDKIVFVKGDILDYDFLLKTVEKYKIEGIVHTALYGCKESSTRTISSFRDNIYPNIDIVENILEIARLKKLKVIDISSIVVYGAAVSSGKWPLDKPITEEDVAQMFPMAPAGPFDSPNFSTGCVMKRITEELTTFYFQEYGVHACSLRLGDVYGPMDTHINMIPIMIRCALAGKTLEIPYGADHVDSHTYNKDAAEAIFSAFTANPLKRSVYNITGGRNWRMEETASEVMTAIPGSVIKLGPGMIPGGFYGISYVRPPISVKAAQAELGYKVTPLGIGIKETAEWIKNNWDFIPRGYYDLLPDYMQARSFK